LRRGHLHPQVALAHRIRAVLTQARRRSEARRGSRLRPRTYAPHGSSTGYLLTCPSFVGRPPSRFDAEPERQWITDARRATARRAHASTPRTTPSTPPPPLDPPRDSPHP